MSFNKYNFKILRLTEEFYNAYPKPQYKEILEKRERPYNCITFEVNLDYFLCIPYRTEINHKYAYKFKSSARSIKHKSGLDYTKMVIVSKVSYLDSSQAVVDNDEYIETVTNIDRIKGEAFDFLEGYTKHIKGVKVLHQSEYKRRYQYSPLQYFHSELKI